jgi:MFS family permease
MTSREWRAGLSLASLFALRMLGLFLILPVFAVHASKNLAGGENTTLVGLAIGIYGLSQGILQIPFGMASDRFGRKPVIIFGLALFAVGSFVAAGAHDIWTVIIGRAVQGTGAISAAVMAMAADLTRDQHRTKIMALIGASIGLMFALSLVAGPVVYRAIGMSGMFDLIGVLALAGIAWTLFVVPSAVTGGSAAAKKGAEGPKVSFGEVLRNVELLRLNLGIFVLHVMQVAMFLVVPVALVDRIGLDVPSHWKVYLPAVLVSFVVMIPLMVAAERRGKVRELFLGAVAIMLLVQLGFALFMHSLTDIVILVTVFFVAFNILEATLPSLVSRLAPPGARGTALGVYNTTQTIGIAVGGPVGGALVHHFGDASVFAFGALAVALWLVFAWGMKPPGQVERRTLPVSSVHNHEDLREKLVRLRGVRDVSFDPARGIAVLQVYAGHWDEQAVLDIIGGSA